MEEKNDDNYKIIADNRLKKIDEQNDVIKLLREHIVNLSKKIDDLLDDRLNNNNISSYDSRKYGEIIDKLEKKVKTLKQDNTCLEYQLLSQNQLLDNPNVEKKRDVLCILCEENVRNVLFRPCNHLVMCDTCSGKSSYYECFMCKQHVESYEYAYLV